MRRFAMSAAIAATTMAATGGIALAAEIEVSPESVPAEGEADFDVILTEFGAGDTVFIVPCAMPDSGNVGDIDPSTCDMTGGSLTQADDNGSAVLKEVWNVPAEGLSLVAGNGDRTEGATALIPVEAIRVLGTQETGDDELAETGAKETLLLLAMGATLIVAGMVSREAGRSVPGVPVG